MSIIIVILVVIVSLISTVLLIVLCRAVSHYYYHLRHMECNELVGMLYYRGKFLSNYLVAVFVKYMTRQTKVRIN